MKTSFWTSVFLVGGTVCGCVHSRPKLPPAKTTTFDGVSAQYVDVTKLPDPCNVDGHQIASQLESVNALMSHFLDVTAPNKATEWTPRQLDQAKRAQELITPAVDAIDDDIQAFASHCPFLEPALRLQDAEKRGRDLIGPTRQRLQELPHRLQLEEHRTAVAEWKAKQGKAIQDAHDTWCPPHPRPGRMPEIYYAAQDENGRTAWLFCDGAKVITSEGGAPQVVPGPGRRHHPERAYLASASKFPPDEIKHAPKLGEAYNMPDSTPKSSDPTTPAEQ